MFQSSSSSSSSLCASIRHQKFFTLLSSSPSSNSFLFLLIILFMLSSLLSTSTFLQAISVTFPATHSEALSNSPTFIVLEKNKCDSLAIDDAINIDIKSFMQQEPQQSLQASGDSYFHFLIDGCENIQKINLLSNIPRNTHLEIRNCVIENPTENQQSVSYAINGEESFLGSNSLLSIHHNSFNNLRYSAIAFFYVRILQANNFSLRIEDNSFTDGNLYESQARFRVEIHCRQIIGVDNDANGMSDDDPRSPTPSLSTCSILVRNNNFDFTKASIGRAVATLDPLAPQSIFLNFVDADNDADSLVSHLDVLDISNNFANVTIDSETNMNTSSAALLRVDAPIIQSVNRILANNNTMTISTHTRSDSNANCVMFFGFLSYRENYNHISPIMWDRIGEFRFENNKIHVTGGFLTSATTVYFASVKDTERGCKYSNWNRAYSRNINSITIRNNTMFLDDSAVSTLRAKTVEFYLLNAVYNVSTVRVTHNTLSAAFFNLVHTVQFSCFHAINVFDQFEIFNNSLDTRTSLSSSSSQSLSENQLNMLQNAPWKYFHVSVGDNVPGGPFYHAITVSLYFYDKYGGLDSEDCLKPGNAAMCYYRSGTYPDRGGEFLRYSDDGTSLVPRLPEPTAGDLSPPTNNFMNISIYSNVMNVPRARKVEGIWFVYMNQTSRFDCHMFNNTLVSVLQPVADVLVPFFLDDSETQFHYNGFYISFNAITRGSNMLIEHNLMDAKYKLQNVPWRSSTTATATALPPIGPLYSIGFVLGDFHLYGNITVVQNTIRVDGLGAITDLQATSAGILLSNPLGETSFYEPERDDPQLEFQLLISKNDILFTNFSGCSPSGCAGIMLAQTSSVFRVKNLLVSENNITMLDFVTIDGKEGNIRNVAAIQIDNEDLSTREGIGPFIGVLPSKFWLPAHTRFEIVEDVNISHNVANLHNVIGTACEFLRIVSTPGFIALSDFILADNSFNQTGYQHGPKIQPQFPFFFTSFFSTVQFATTGTFSREVLRRLGFPDDVPNNIPIPFASVSGQFRIAGDFIFSNNKIAQQSDPIDAWFTILTGIRVDGNLTFSGNLDIRSEKSAKSLFRFAPDGFSTNSGGPTTNLPNGIPMSIRDFKFAGNRCELFLDGDESSTNSVLFLQKSKMEYDTIALWIVNSSNVTIVKTVIKNDQYLVLPSLVDLDGKFEKVDVRIVESNLTLRVVSSSPPRTKDFVGSAFSRAIFNNLPLRGSSVSISNNSFIVMDSPVRSSIVSLNRDNTMASTVLSSLVEVVHSQIEVPQNDGDRRRLFVSNSNNDDAGKNSLLMIRTQCAKWNDRPISIFADYSSPVRESKLIFERCEGEFTPSRTFSDSISVVPQCANGMQLVDTKPDETLTVKQYMRRRRMSLTIAIVLERELDTPAPLADKKRTVPKEEYNVVEGQQQSEAFTRFRQHLELAWPDSGKLVLSSSVQEQQQQHQSRPLGAPTLSSTSFVYSSTPNAAVVQRAYSVSPTAIRVDLVFPSPAFAEVADPSQPPFPPLDPNTDHEIELTVKPEAFACAYSSSSDNNNNKKLKILLKGRPQIPGLSTAAREAISTGSDVAMVATAMGMSSGPMIAKAKARSVLLQRYSSCEFDPEEPLEFELSPLDLVIGSDVGRYLRGAIIGNGLVFVIFSSLIFALALVWIGYKKYKERNKRKMKKRNNDDSNRGSNKKKTKSDAVSFLSRFGKTSLAMGLLPVLLNLQTILMQGSVSASVSLYLYGPHDPPGLRAFDRMMAVLCVGASFVFGAWMIYAVFFQLRRYPTIQFVTKEEDAARRLRKYHKAGITNPLMMKDGLASSDDESPDEDEVIQHILHVPSSECSKCAQSRTRNRVKEVREERRKLRRSRSIMLKKRRRSSVAADRLLSRSAISERDVSEIANRASQIEESEETLRELVPKRMSRLARFIRDHMKHSGEWKTVKFPAPPASAALVNKEPPLSSTSSSLSSHSSELIGKTEYSLLTKTLVQAAKTKKEAKRFFEHFVDLFYDLSGNLPSYFVLEYCLTFIMACIEGYHPDPASEACQSIGTIISILNALPLAVVIAYNPVMRHWSTNWYVLFSSFVITIQSVIVLLGFYNSSFDFFVLELALNFVDVVFELVDMSQLAFDTVTLYVDSPRALTCFVNRIKHTIFHSSKWAYISLLVCSIFQNSKTTNKASEHQEELHHHFPRSQKFSLVLDSSSVSLQQQKQQEHEFGPDDDDDDQELLQNMTPRRRNYSNRRQRNTASRCWNDEVI